MGCSYTQNDQQHRYDPCDRFAMTSDSVVSHGYITVSATKSPFLSSFSGALQLQHAMDCKVLRFAFLRRVLQEVP